MGGMNALRCLLLCLTFALVCTGWSYPATSQQDDHLAAAPTPEAISPERRAERAERLDQLFAELQGAPGDIAAQFVADEIEAIWSDVGDPTATLFTERARTAMLSGELVTARQLVDAALVRAPHSHMAWRLSARLALEQDDAPRALIDVERALVAEPRDYEALATLGRVLEKLERPRAAYEAYLSAHMLNPFHSVAGAGMNRTRAAAEGRQS